VLAFGIPGPREVGLIVLVVLALYGRSGTRLLMATRYGRSLQPWLRLVGVGERSPAGSRPGASVDRPRAGSLSRSPSWLGQGRWFWAFALAFAALAAAWVATRIVVMNAH
jgi:hypothetical protein